MVKKKWLEEERLYAGVLIGWLSYYTVIYLAFPAGSDHLLGPSDLFDGPAVVPKYSQEYVQQIVGQYRRENRAIVYPFNAEVAILSRPASAINLANLSQSALNARVLDLGDLFMDEMFIQSNLDVEEASRLLNAGFVSKEDLDVQRLVDVLWSQDVDLGVGRESFEFPLRAASALPLPDKPLSETSFKETVLSEAAFRDSHSLNLDNGNFYVDEETGELIPKSLPSLPTLPKSTLPTGLKNEACKESGEASFECFDYLSSQHYQQPERVPHLQALQAANGTDVEAAQLQSLINALDSLNSSTLQAVIDQGIAPDVKVMEEQWGDVESIISGSASLPPIQTAALSGAQSGGNLAEVALVGPNNVENSTSMANFDLFSVLMDPPVNWTLSSATLPSGRYNGEDYGASSSFVSGLSTSATAPNGTLTSVGQDDPFNFGGLANQENAGQVYPYYVPLSTGSFGGASSVPLLNYTNMFEWNMTDWSNNTFSTVSTLNPRTGMVDQNDWKFTELTKQEAPSVNTEVASLTQDAVRVKREDNGEGWKERVGLAVSLNHSYASPAPPPVVPSVATPAGRRRLSLQSREGSEEDGSSSSDPFSINGGRSRSSRDERAALEAGLPLTATEIIRLPVEEFNGYISGQVGQLLPEQVQMMKDIRRRGKNKVAAQNCRKRKIDNMSHLEREIMGIREELKREAQRRDELLRERDLHRAALARGPVIQSTSTPSSSSEPVPTATRRGHDHVQPSQVAKEHATKPIRKRKQPEEQ